MATSIEVENVSKQFSMRYQRTLKQVVVAKLRGQKTKDDFWALQDVSFAVEQGEAIGLMGLNGSGKSTLLKHIMGVMRPTSGQVRTRGRVSGLIATGAGFHAEMTGRENIYMNAAILGMTQDETDAKYPAISEFAELGDRMDTPVGNYSSGMAARLGFSVAVNVDCDVFIADEVLAVGDQPFKKKCMKKMEEIRDSGVTLFYVSHAAQSVRKMCTRVIVLEKGVVGFDGDVDEGIRYLHYDDDDDPDAEEVQNTDAELGSEI
jgi:ABC-2 type transport system ATP-binding protein